ncbi:MAG: hypothetical protein V1911_01640, partial [Candidatus Micrarchaeota archaeon]
KTTVKNSRTGFIDDVTVTVYGKKAVLIEDNRGQVVYTPVKSDGKIVSLSIDDLKELDMGPKSQRLAVNPSELPQLIDPRKRTEVINRHINENRAFGDPEYISKMLKNEGRAGGVDTRFLMQLAREKMPPGYNLKKHIEELVKSGKINQWQAQRHLESIKKIEEKERR